MKKTILLLLISIITLTVQASEKLYQVMTSDPHDLEKFESHITTVKRDGRLWIVKLKSTFPANQKKFVRFTDLSDVGSYQPMVLKQRDGVPFKDIVDQANKDNVKATIAHLSSYKTRLSGSEDNRKATAWIEEQFKSMGYETKQLCYKAGICSVLAEKKAKSENTQAILVEAHLDSVGKNQAGADDNASGTASLLEIARVLSTQELKMNLRFLATNGEEQGLYGAKHYANLLTTEGTIKDLKLVINMDMVGYNSNGIVELETNKEFEGLAKWFAQLAADYTILKSKITLGAWGSDHVPFLEKGVSTILTIEDWSTKTPCYHQECDKPATINHDYATEITKLNIAAVLTKDAE